MLFVAPQEILTALHYAGSYASPVVSNLQCLEPPQQWQDVRASRISESIVAQPFLGRQLVSGVIRLPRRLRAPCTPRFQRLVEIRDRVIRARC